MARLFDDDSSEYLSITTPVITAYPFAMACKFRTNDDTYAQTLVWVGDKDVDTHYCSLVARGGDVGVPIRAATQTYGGGSTGHAETSTGLTANTWHTAAGIWLSVSERHVYIDGGSKGSNTDTVGAMANHDNTAIGVNFRSTIGGYMSGDIAEAAIWDLTNWGANDAERETNFEKVIASLAKGFSPLFFPLGLVSYWDLVRGLNDKIGGYNLTANGTVISAHPRVITPPPTLQIIHKTVIPSTVGGIMTTNTGYWGAI